MLIVFPRLFAINNLSNKGKMRVMNFFAAPFLGAQDSDQFLILSRFCREYII